MFLKIGKVISVIYIYIVRVSVKTVLWKTFLYFILIIGLRTRFLRLWVWGYNVFFVFPDICKCRYSCKNISHELKLKLREDYLKIKDRNRRNTFLVQLVSVTSVNRRRNGKYATPSESRRQCTFSYVIPNMEGNTFRVCKATFLDIFTVSQKRFLAVQKMCKDGILMHEDMR